MTVGQSGGAGGGAGLGNASGTTWAASLKVTTLQLNGVTTGWTPEAAGTVTLNGTAAATITGVNGTNAFPANATFALSINTVGGTPGLSAPYFFTATTANAAQLKSLTVNANDVYNWAAMPTPGITLTSANLDIYIGMSNPRTGCRYGLN
jgi:hypothetical protein